MRTFSNSLEATAAAAGLYHMFRYRAAGADAAAKVDAAKADAAKGSLAAQRQLHAALLAAGLGVIVRPSSLLFWLLPGEQLWLL